MSDVKERILEVLKRPQLACLATTTEDGKPWVRYVFIVGSDDLTVRCATFVNARKVAQIKKNSEVHFTCGITELTDTKPYLQVQCRAAFSTDQAEKAAFWNPGLESIFKGADDPDYGVIVAESYRIELCSPGTHEPEVWER
jgi:general stress protein 26